MADITGGTPPTNASAFAVPADITAVYDHFGGPTFYHVANAAALPSSGNWAGRQCMTDDTDALYAHNGTAWRLVSQPWTVFTPSLLSGTMTLGSGGSTLYANYKVNDGEATVRIGWAFGTSGFSWNDPVWNYPIAAASWISSYVVPIGTWHFIDISAGAAGRFVNDITSQAGLRMTLSNTSGVSILLFGATAPNGALATTDQMHLSATYPI